MIYQIIITAALTLFLVNLILNLRALRKPSPDSKAPEPAPLISVLIPARNEEANIRACLESLQKQDYPNFEVLVLDDDSDDATNSIVCGMAAKDKRIRLIQGKPLPADWAGKPFACHQLAQQAKGPWLLFVDADTIHAPHMLRSVLALAIELKTSLLSGFNHQITKSFPLKVIMPVMYFIILGWAPLWWLHRTKKPKPSVAIGQFLFFARDDYWRMGGHQAVKNKLVEDIWMGAEVSKHGGRHIAVDLSQVVSCYMYRTVGDAWSGLGKSIQAVIAISPMALVGLVVIATFIYLAPWIYLYDVFFAGWEPFEWRFLVGLQITITLSMRWLIDNRFREPGISMWFQFFGMFFYLVNVLYSAWRLVTGAPVNWKERSYPNEQTVER